MYYTLAESYDYSNMMPNNLGLVLVGAMALLVLSNMSPVVRYYMRMPLVQLLLFYLIAHACVGCPVTALLIALVATLVMQYVMYKQGERFNGNVLQTFNKLTEQVGDKMVNNACRLCTDCRLNGCKGCPNCMATAQEPTPVNFDNIEYGFANVNQSEWQSMAEPDHHGNLYLGNGCTCGAVDGKHACSCGMMREMSSTNNLTGLHTQMPVVVLPEEDLVSRASAKLNDLKDAISNMLA